MKKKIWVCLATKNNEVVAKQTIEAIFELSELHQDDAIGLMVLDKSDSSTLKPWMNENYPDKHILYQNRDQILSRDQTNSSLYQDLNYDLRQDSVQRARIQLLLASKDFWHEFRGGIIWQIDDDILLKEAVLEDSVLSPKLGRNFFQEARDYHRQHPNVDAAIGNYTNTPPLPILLYAEKQLGDLLKDQREASVTKEYFGETDNYHDLYPNKEFVSIPSKPGLHFLDQFSALMQGKAVTRPLLSQDHLGKNANPQRTLLRGGNFIIFNPIAALRFPHFSLQYDGLIGRRSDMIHAWMLSQKGFVIRGIDISLFHNRSFPSLDFEKIANEYLSDALGAIAFRFLNSVDQSKQRFTQHKNHLKRLKKLSRQLVEQYPSGLTKDFSLMVGRTQQRLESWDWNTLKEALIDFEFKVEKLSNQDFRGHWGNS